MRIIATLVWLGVLLGGCAGSHAMIGRTEDDCRKSSATFPEFASCLERRIGLDHDNAGVAHDLATLVDQGELLNAEAHLLYRQYALASHKAQGARIFRAWSVMNY